MSDPRTLITYCTNLAALLVTNKTTIGITGAELRFEGQGVSGIKPALVVVLTPPDTSSQAPGLCTLDWNVTLFAMPDEKATVAEEIGDALTILQKAHSILMFGGYHDLVLNSDSGAHVDIVSGVPNNVVCALSYKYLFAFP